MVDFEVLLIVGGEAVRVALWLAAGGRGLTFGGETGEGFFLVALWVAEGGRGLTFGVWMGEIEL